MWPVSQQCQHSVFVAGALLARTVGDMVTLLLAVLAEEILSTAMGVEECPRDVIVGAVYLVG